MKKTPPAPPGRRLRRLSDEEIALWVAVAETIERRRDARLPERIAVPAPATPEAPDPMPVVRAAPPRPHAKPALPPLAPLERRLKQKLSRGHVGADAAIDLHGMRQDEALPALRQFLARMQQRGASVVIVVTGKGGRPGPLVDGLVAETGVLRRMVPLWLHLPEFRPLVIGFEEAARHHGGTGALYVRLRRPKRD